MRKLLPQDIVLDPHDQLELYEVFVRIEQGYNPTNQELMVITKFRVFFEKWMAENAFKDNRLVGK